MDKIIITGGAGLIGKQLCYCLHKNNYEVHSVDNYCNSNEIEEEYETHNIDICDQKKIKELFEEIKPKIVYHLACHPYEGLSQFMPYDVAESTLIGTISVLTASINVGTVKRFINFSSMARYGKGHHKNNIEFESSSFDSKLLEEKIIGPPFKENFTCIGEDIYGCSKIADENCTKILCELHNIEWINVVPHNVFGESSLKCLGDPYRGVVMIWVNTLLKGGQIYIYGDGEQKRALTYVGDIVETVMQLSYTDKIKNESVNIGSDKVYTINALSNLICKLFTKITGKDCKTPIHIEGIPCEVKYSWCSHEKINNSLNFDSNKDIEKGLENVIRWALKIAPNGVENRYKNEFEINKKVPEGRINK